MKRLADTLAVTLLVAIAVGRPHPASATEDTVLVDVDRAKVVRLDRPAYTVIVGNPSIADALVQDRQMLVVTGKSYGATNLIVLDENGNTIDDFILHVRGDDSGIVTVQRGATRLSYSCAPSCERTLMIGDTPESYDALTGQIEKRLGLAEGQAGTQ